MRCVIQYESTLLKSGTNGEKNIYRFFDFILHLWYMRAVRKNVYILLK